MNPAAVLCLVGALTGLYLAAFHWPFLSVKRWGQRSYVALVALFSAVFVGLNLYHTLPFYGAAALWAARLQLPFGALTVSAWLRYSEVEVPGGSSRFGRMIEKVALGTSLLALVPGLTHSGATAVQSIPWLGITYRHVVPTPACIPVYGVLLVGLVTVALRYLRALRARRVAALPHLVAASSVTLAGIHDAIASAGFLVLPYLLDAALLVEVAAIGLISSRLWTRDVLRLEARRSAERRESEQRYRRYIDGAPIAIVILDAGGRIAEANPAGTALLGRESVGRNWLDLIDPDDRPAAAAKLAATADGGRLRTDLRLRRSSGAQVRLEASAVALPDGGLLAFLVDITERERANEQLRKLSLAVEQSPAAMLITDADGFIEYVNAAFARSTGFSSEEARGKTPRIVSSGATAGEVYEDLWRSIRSGREWQGQLQNRRKDGQLYWSLTHISPLLNAEGQVTHFLGVQQDVTALRDLEERLRQSQKMEALGRLAGGVAHDFNNLLTVILSGVMFLRDAMSPDDARQVDLAEIGKAGERAAGLTRQLLSFSKKSSVAPRALDLNQLVERSGQMIRRLIGEDVRLTISSSATPVCVVADPLHLEQVILNLAVNAREAMPGGGTLAVATSAERESALLTVSDTGCGMDDATRARIFEPFFTTKPTGTGLGLATVYGIVGQAGGTIVAESAPGRGTVFRISLPLAAPSEEIVAQALSPLPRGRVATVLLVEDDESVRSTAKRALEVSGLRVIDAGSGEEALRLLDAGLVIDLLLTDVVMPGLDGRALAARVSARMPTVQVLLISGYADDAAPNPGTPEHRLPIVRKPFTPDTLAKRVAQLLS